MNPLVAPETHAYEVLRLVSAALGPAEDMVHMVQDPRTPVQSGFASPVRPFDDLTTGPAPLGVRA